MPKRAHALDRQIGDWAWSSELFWRKVTKGTDTACWAWTGSTSPYGPLFGAKKLKTDGTYQPQMTQARRILWAEHTGTYLADRQNIFHACGNKNCMNPDHLTEDKVFKPREQRQHMGRHKGSRVIDGRVVRPSRPEPKSELEIWAAMMAQGAN
jgi:hypothetical protein